MQRKQSLTRTQVWPYISPLGEPHIVQIERVPIENRDQWLSLRRQVIGASETGIVCGEGAYGSLAELYAEKKGLRPPQIDSGVLRRGRWQEAAVFEALQDERPEWQISRAKIFLREPELRIGCTPDGLALAPGRPGRGVIQAKSVARSVFKRRWLVEPDDPIADGEAYPPAYYILQVLTEMMLCESSWGVLACLVTGEFDNTLRLFEIEPDATTQGRMLYHVEAFWQDYFDRGIMPPFEPQRDELLIKALFPLDTGKTIDLRQDNRAAAAVEELLETSAALKRMTDRQRALKTELQGKLGDHSYGLLVDGRRISWRLQHRRAFTVKASDHRVLKILKARDDDDET